MGYYFEVKIYASKHFFFSVINVPAALIKSPQLDVFILVLFIQSGNNLFKKEYCLLFFPFFLFCYFFQTFQQEGFVIVLCFVFIIFLCIFHYVIVSLVFCEHYLIEKRRKTNKLRSNFIHLSKLPVKQIPYVNCINVESTNTNCV